MAGWLADRLADRLADGVRTESLWFRFLLRLISVKCYYSVRNTFQLAFLKYSLFRGVF